MPHDLVSLPTGPVPPPAGGQPGDGAILIVEDNQVNAMILRAMLRKHGHEPIVARDGAEGVEMTCRLRPRLVLMDLQMPRLDGYAAAGAIRQSGTAAPVLVAVTASTTGEVCAACRAAGFACVLAKPIALAELIDVVRRYLACDTASASGSRIA